MQQHVPVNKVCLQPEETAVIVQAVLELVKLKPTVIRGNASEIMAVAGAAGVATKGVDSTAEAEDALELGKRLAAEAGCVVAISGATDLASCTLPSLLVSKLHSCLAKCRGHDVVALPSHTESWFYFMGSSPWALPQ